MILFPLQEDEAVTLTLSSMGLKERIKDSVARHIDSFADIMSPKQK